jgi:hypothetical protein
MTPGKRKPTYDPHSNPIRLFQYFRKQSIDPSKSEAERAAARNHMMDCWSRVPWGLAADVLDMKENNKS